MTDLMNIPLHYLIKYPLSKLTSEKFQQHWMIQSVFLSLNNPQSKLKPTEASL